MPRDQAPYGTDVPQKPNELGPSRKGFIQTCVEQPQHVDGHDDGGTPNDHHAEDVDSCGDMPGQCVGDMGCPTSKSTDLGYPSVALFYSLIIAYQPRSHSLPRTHGRPRRGKLISQR